MLTQAQLRTIRHHIDQGDESLNLGDFSQALKFYQQAASFVPEPKTDHEIALPVLTAIGEALFYAQRYSEALAAFQTAVKAPGGVENPLIHLRLGQTYFELDALDRAADELMRAYMLEGKDIFRGEDEAKYLVFLKTRVDI